MCCSVFACCDCWLYNLFTIYIVWRLCVSSCLCRVPTAPDRMVHEFNLNVIFASYHIPYMPDQKSVKMHSVYLYATSRYSIFVCKKNTIFEFFSFCFILFPFLHILFFFKSTSIDFITKFVCVYVISDFYFLFNCCLSFTRHNSIWKWNFQFDTFNFSFSNSKSIRNVCPLWFSILFTSHLPLLIFVFKQIYVKAATSHFTQTNHSLMGLLPIHLFIDWFFLFNALNWVYNMKTFLSIWASFFSVYSSFMLSVICFEFIHLHSMSISFSLCTYSLMCVACMREKNTHKTLLFTIWASVFYVPQSAHKRKNFVAKA